MAMPRRGLITVDGAQYRWLIRRRPTYSQAICETPLTVAVELADRPTSVAVAEGTLAKGVHTRRRLVRAP